MEMNRSALMSAAACALTFCLALCACSGGKPDPNSGEGEPVAPTPSPATDPEPAPASAPHSDAWAVSPNGVVYIQSAPNVSAPAGETLTVRSTTDDSFIIGYGNYDNVQVMGLDMTYDEKLRYDSEDGSIKVSEGPEVVIAGVTLKSENRTWISAWVDDVLYYAEVDGVLVQFVVRADTYPEEVQALLEYAVLNVKTDKVQF